MIGRHAGAGGGAKAAAVGSRSLALGRWARPKRFDLALAHGSVDIAVVSAVLRIPLVQMQDYEFAGVQRQLAFRAARRVLAPDAISPEAMRRAGAAPRKLFRYPGLKEDYYLYGLEPDRGVIDDLGLARERVIAVVRPPPESSAYHAENPVYEGMIDRLAEDDGAQAVVIPRTDSQRAALSRRGAENLIIPERAIDGQSLVAQADVVVGAGGTMNREAVALGTPVWTLFSGRMGAVDEALISAGRMRVLSDPKALELRKRSEPIGVREPRDPQLLVDAVLAATGR